MRRKEENIHQHEQRIRSVISRAYTEHGWVPVHDPMTMDEMLERDPEVDFSDEIPDGVYTWPNADQKDLKLEHLKREEAMEVAEWARRNLMYWLAGDGIHPFQILQRFYALCHARYSDLIGPLNGTWLAEILGQGRAAFSALMHRLFNIPVKLKTGREITLPGQKSVASKKKYADNAKKNKPRQSKNATGVSILEQPGVKVKALMEQHLKAAQEKAEMAQQLEDTKFFQNMKQRAAALQLPQNTEDKSSS